MAAVVQHPIPFGEWFTDNFDDPLQVARRQDFIQRIYGMPNGGAQKYRRFFRTFLDRLNVYMMAHNPGNQRMTNTIEFFALISILKAEHRPFTSVSFEDMVTRLSRQDAAQAIWPHVPQPTEIMIEYAIWLGLWTWLQITALATTFGGVTSLGVQDAGQIVHPWRKDKSLKDLTRSDLLYSQGVPENQQSHEFSTYFNVRDLQSCGIQFLPTANLLDHLRVSRDYPKKYEMTVFIFHNRPMLFVMLKGDNGTPKWYRDVAQETLNTLHLLAPYDVPACMDEFARLFRVDLWQPMNDHPGLGPPRYVSPVPPPHGFDPDDNTVVTVQTGQAVTQEYLTRSLRNYPYWGARLLELEDIARGQNPSTFNEWSDHQREERIAWVTWIAFFLSIIALVFTILAAIWGLDSLKESKQANAYASIASVAGDQDAGQTSSFLSSLGCCCASCSQAAPTLTDNNTTTTSLVSMRTTHVVTVTATTLVTVTVTTIIDTR